MKLYFLRINKDSKPFTIYKRAYTLIVGMRRKGYFLMFCYQYRQDSYTRICSVKGICAKDPACSAVEEFLLQGLKAISIYVKKISEYGGSLEGFSEIATKIFNTSINNLTSDNDEIMRLLKEIDITKEEFKIRYNEIIRARGFQVDLLDQSLYWQPKYRLSEIIREGEKLSLRRCKANPPDINCLIDLLLHSVRGMAQYFVQAKSMGLESIDVTRFLYEAVFSLTQDLDELKLQNLLERSGEINLIALKLVQEGLYNRYGQDDIAKIKTSPVKGKSILVSGKDLKDLEDILTATVSKGINVYTHGEMMMAHVFPELRAFPNLIGNYGGVSNDQQSEVESFPGAVLITSNCIWDPPEVYRGRVFTTGLPSWPGIKQIVNQNYCDLINSAMDAEGFKEDYVENFTEVGFNYEKFDSIMTKVQDGIEKGKIKHIFLLVGCSSLNSQKGYVSDFIENVPDDCIVIKFAGLNYQQQKGYVEIDGLPQILEFGLFDDLLSVVKIFLSSEGKMQSIISSNKFSTVFFLRDQSALSVLLSITQFKKNNIKIGTCTPSLLSPMIFKALDNAFNIKRVTTPQDDIKELLGKQT